MVLANAVIDFLENLDISLFLSINEKHNGFFDQFMYAFSGKVVWVPMYISIVYMMVRNIVRPQLFYAILGLVLIVLFADQVCGGLIRPMVERWRPSNVNSPVYDVVHIVNGYRGGRYGFPSCHAANTLALATYIMLLFKNRWLTTFLMVWAFITCYSRSYLGVHYPGDLLVGGLVGSIGSFLVYGLLVRYGRYTRPEDMKLSYLPVWVGLITIIGIMISATIKQ